jgi:hypothetical protein
MTSKPVYAGIKRTKAEQRGIDIIAVYIEDDRI